MSITIYLSIARGKYAMLKLYFTFSVNEAVDLIPIRGVFVARTSSVRRSIRVLTDINRNKHIIHNKRFISSREGKS